VVQSIEKVRTGNKGGNQDVPVDAVVINSAKLEA
jgi:cyclophilin family peptidyl-prolyl cis-trans isomerase